MGHTYLKKAAKTPLTGSDETSATVREMLATIEAGREDAALEYARNLDGYDGPAVVTPEAVAEAGKKVAESLKDDIDYAYQRVTDFARAQRDSIQEFESEISPGIWAGQKIIPMETIGAYVPGGRYAHVASAIMSVATAKVAGVEHVTATTAPGKDGPNPAILYTMGKCGADTIFSLGGVQGIAAMAYGLFTDRPARLLVGPGNRFVAEAKRQLFGRCGIDMIAGPTEIAIIADDTADAQIVAEDLVSQAEHGPDSPAWLFTTSERLANDVTALMPGLIAALPETARNAATTAWDQYGEIILCDSDEDMALVSDEYAAEHLEVHTVKDAWFTERLKNYGSLFVGEETTVTYGDKCSGTNHILPTRGAAHYTGGLSVHKFVKIVTTQRMTRDANKTLGATAARISRLEGMEGHARAADARLRKYFPGDNIDTGASA